MSQDGNRNKRLSGKFVAKEDCDSTVQKRPRRLSIGPKKSESIDHDAPQCNRRCEKTGCGNESETTCFAKTNTRCVSYSNYTSRWYHISIGEHYCNECFENFYRASKPGHAEYKRWKSSWSANSKTEPSVKLYMGDQLLPHWIKCTKLKCRRWKELPNDIELTPQLITTFTCQFLNGVKKKGTCGSEDERVKKVLDPTWIQNYLSLALLKNSPAADLLGAYYSDGVGLSPTCSRCVKALKIYQEQRKIMLENGESNDAPLSPHINGLNPHFEPFYQPAEQGRALCVRPDVIAADEEAEFGEITRKFPSMYLGIRNLIIALWNIHCKEWLTEEVVESHLIVRGLVRIYCCQLAKKILKYLTVKGTVNVGVINSPINLEYIPSERKPSVIVIGAGISGLGAARHLHNLGLKTMVLEARNRIGGRIWDDNSFQVCMGKGAQIVTGVINNPITLICEQTGLKMRFLGERCELFASNGVVVDPIVDRDVEYHFNNSLDVVASWRKTSTKDESLYAKVFEAHVKILSDNHITVTEEQRRLFNFHLSNLEYACGANLKQVSAMYWDQNEAYEQFSGDHTMLWEGYSSVIEKLAEGVEIQLGKVVKSIDYSSKGEVKVKLENGDVLAANKVLVTVPLAIMQAGDIKFVPTLPKSKQEALKNLGAGAIDKIVLQFTKCFWSSKIRGADFFGYISPNEEDRGQFPLFCDMSRYEDNATSSRYILMTYLCGDAVKLTKTKTDLEIISMCTNVLKGLFPDEDVPNPINYFVTKWTQDPYSKMVYSYVKLGSTGEEYDVLAEPLEDKVYFAGEATNRRFPQTVAGAYVSGLREVHKIMKSL